MSLRIITGSTGTNHVTSQDDGSFNQVVLGAKSVVLDIGNKLSATIVDNNTIRLSDGDLLLQGRHARLNAGTTEDITIGTGSIGNNRNDLIVARYSMSSTTGYEKIEFKVIEGTETSGSATDPTYNTGNIRTGSTLVDFPLYRVRLTGINIAGVDKLFETTGGAGSSLIASGYSATTSYKYGEVCINNGEMWTSLVSNNVGNTPTEGVYWTKSSIANQMGGLKFGKDGDGNCGYYGDDGVLIPFKSGGGFEPIVLYGKCQNATFKKYFDNDVDSLVFFYDGYGGACSVVINNSNATVETVINGHLYVITNIKVGDSISFITSSSNEDRHLYFLGEGRVLKSGRTTTSGSIAYTDNNHHKKIYLCQYGNSININNINIDGEMIHEIYDGNFKLCGYRCYKDVNSINYSYVPSAGGYTASVVIIEAD